jgi:hypothetical protein
MTYSIEFPPAHALVPALLFFYIYMASGVSLHPFRWVPSKKESSEGASHGTCLLPARRSGPSLLYSSLAQEAHKASAGSFALYPSYGEYGAGLGFFHSFLCLRQIREREQRYRQGSGRSVFAFPLSSWLYLVC